MTYRTCRPHVLSFQHHITTTGGSGRGVSAYVRADLRRRIRKHFADCCAYCHTAERLTVAVFELDHIVPRSAGGETVFENVCLACPTCHRSQDEGEYRRITVSLRSVLTQLP